MAAKPLRRLFSTVTTVVIVVNCAGCGGEQGSSSEQIERAIVGLQSDLADRDLSGVCSALGAKPKFQIGTIGHERRPSTCERDLREFLAGMGDAAAIKGEPPLDLRSMPRPQVVRVRVSGDEAVVVSNLDGKRLDIPFAREDGKWKLADLFVVTGPVRRDLR